MLWLATILFVPATGKPVADPVILNPGHHATNEVRAKLSPDGRVAVSLGGDRCARVWDAGTGKLVAELWLAEGMGSDHLNRMWIAPEGATLALPFHTSEEPRGKLALLPLTGPNRGTYRVIGGSTFEVSEVAFSPDAKRVAIASTAPPVLVCDTATGKVVSEIKYDPDMRPRGMNFSADGKQLTIGLPMFNFNGDKHSSTGTFDAATGKFLSEVRWEEPQPFVVPTTPPVVVASATPPVQLSADGKRAMIQERGEISFATAPFTAERPLGTTRTRVAHDHLVNTLAWQGERGLAWGHGPIDGRNKGPVERALDFTELKASRVDPKAKLAGRRAEWGGVKLSDDGYRATATANGKNVRLDYDPEYDFDDIKATTLVGPGHAILVTAAGTAGYDTATGKQVCTYAARGGWALVPSPDGKLFAVTDFFSPVVRVLRVGQSEPALTLFPVGDEWVAWTNDGSWASSPGGARFAGALSKPEPGKLPVFVPFPASQRDPDAVRAALK